MKNLKLFLISSLFLCLAQNSFSASLYLIPQKDAKQKHTVTISMQNRQAMEAFVKLTPKQYADLRGKKLSFVERIEFKILQKKLKKQLSYYDGEDSSGFNIGGFLLGFFLGLLGALLSFISKDRNFRKWAWIGFGSWIVLLLILVAIVG